MWLLDKKEKIALSLWCAACSTKNGKRRTSALEKFSRHRHEKSVCSF